MSVIDEAARLNAAGRREEAVALVTRAAAGDDPEALFALANWRLFGLFGARDLGEAHRLLARAGERGSVEAVRTAAILTANGTGCSPDPAAAERMLRSIGDRDPHAALQLALLEGMPAPEAYPPERSETLSERPLVKRYAGLLSPRECAYLMGMAEPQLRPSYVTNPATGAQMPHPIRTSTGMSYGPTLEDLVVRRLNERIARASGTQTAWGEPLHILRYDRGQEYRPHTDSMPGDTDPRVWTVLIYLNDAYEGGATSFPRAGLSFRGAPGDALMFRNVTQDGRPDGDSLHAGLPIEKGVKWLATRWIRSQPYHPWHS
ncbi:2OG-Fe(II) oxygenase [Qipengyuania sediminis]|uniref:2OG-Fe(II) oxygenase n=1 Tax=Qipengyuania sediminis TaxID=1532023 RepID=UPI00105A44D5|nr:2OG-Fe(II) oxygenase [Qipengyuania sediminis]